MLAGGWDRQTSKLPDDEEAQIDQAFDNVQEALRVAGVENGWEKVSYEMSTACACACANLTCCLHPPRSTKSRATTSPSLTRAYLP